MHMQGLQQQPCMLAHHAGTICRVRACACMCTCEPCERAHTHRHRYILFLCSCAERDSNKNAVCWLSIRCVCFGPLRGLDSIWSGRPL